MTICSNLFAASRPDLNVHYNNFVDQETILKLVNLNKQFYQTFGEAFSQTRQRIQPGVRAALSKIPRQGNWMDLGCGNGALAVEWLKSGKAGVYRGLDFSEVLLQKAREAIALNQPPLNLIFEFEQANLIENDWIRTAGEGCWDGVMAFAVLHHIPDTDLRKSILQVVFKVLKSGGLFIHSEWQFQNSEKWMARRQPWTKIGIDAKDIDIGDTLLDWRHVTAGQTDEVGLRYVHLFTREELATLARQTGFSIIDEYESDGEGGKLGLYQTWQKPT